MRFAHRHGHDAAGAAYFVAFFDVLVFAQQHRADLIFFQVHRDAGNVVAENSISSPAMTFSRP